MAVPQTRSYPPPAQSSNEMPNAQRPLPPSVAGRTALLAAGLLLAFYVLCLLALLADFGLMLCLFVIMIAASRLGLAGVLRAPLAALSRLAVLICRSLNLRRGPEYTMPLHPAQAPRLFALVEQVAGQVGVAPPDQVRLEMSDNAWVKLRGYRQGRGRCTLGIGYDLLALLTEAELGAVLAHEMAHARLAQRGLGGWLSRCLARMIQLARALEELTGTAPRRRFFTAELLERAVSVLTRSVARAFALLSRQDEFDADRLAAGLCGPDLYAQMLTTLAVSGVKGADLSWRDRLIQFQREGALTDWVRRARRPVDEAERERLIAVAQDPERRSEFSTHPTLADRLDALPTEIAGRAEGGPFLTSTAPALSLLGDADALASSLIAELERVAAQEEQKDSRHLRRAVRKTRGQRRKHTPGETVGMFFIALGMLGLLGGLCLFVIAAADHGPGAGGEAAAASVIVGGAVALIALGAALVRVFRFRDRMPLPIPSFARWEDVMEARDLTQSGIASQSRRRHEMAAALRAELPSGIRRSEQAHFWARHAYEALSDCDFLRADAAAGLCLAARASCVEGQVARGVAAAYYDDGTTLGQTLGVAVHDYGAGPSLSWGIGWALTMLGRWERAEAYLHEALTGRAEPAAATLWSLLATCQWQQGKVREAAHSARQALSLQPQESAHRVLLMRVLIAAGRPLDAAQELAALGSGGIRTERALWVALNVALLLGRDAEATEHASALDALAPSPKTLLRLADLYADTARDETAREYLERACLCGFCPQALVGLARLAFRRSEYEAARTGLLSALDMTRIFIPEGVPPLALMETILRGLAAMNGPACVCQEWLAQVTLSAPSPSARRADGAAHLLLRVAAPSLAEAERYAAELYEAMRPGCRLADAQTGWTLGQTFDPTDDRVQPGVFECRFR